MQAHGASPAIMFSHIGARNIRSMLTGTTLALVLISLILMFALRSLRIGLISLIPNLVPAGMAFGLWGLLVGQVGLALSVVAGMTLGIVVDDTVHFLSKYLRARREEGMPAADAVRYAFHTVGTALWTTSAVLMAGFLVLTHSPFEINSAMGLLTAITIGLALLADFLLLPTLLMTLDKKEAYESNQLADPVKSIA
jgi:predicted RND superfamily exporter protein